MLFSSLSEVAALLRNRTLTASEVCTKCLKRLKNVEKLNVLVTSTPALARKQAEESDRRLERGSPLSTLDGIPVIIKDNYNTEGVLTSCASKMLHNYIPPYNATVVQKLLDNGANMLGKANMDEFAMGSACVDSFYRPVRNPWKFNFSKSSPGESSSTHTVQNNESSASQTFTTSTRHLHQATVHKNRDNESDVLGDDSDTDWHVPGGSSGGSAAAVAAGVCFAATGSDTGGSVRVPAAYCGVVGLKPTYGLLSRHGLISLVNSMDVPGIFTRTVDDTVTVLNTLAGHDPKDSTSVMETYVPFSLPDEVSVKDIHVGIPKDFDYAGLTSEVQDAWNQLADTLERGGAKVSQISLPHNKYSLAVYSVLNCCEVASNMARYDGIEFGHRASNNDSTEALYSATRHEGFNDVVRGRILCGNYFLLEGNYENYFVKAQQVRQLIADDFNQVYNSGVDVILTPTTLGTAPTYHEFISGANRVQQQKQDIYTMAANLVGIPAVSVPVQVSKNGLPIGLQLMGQSFQEQQLLSVSKWIEQQMNFPHLNLDYLD